MHKKLLGVGIGIALLASPLIASAQTVSASSNASLIAILTQLVQTLEQELQQLIATQSGTTPVLTTTNTQVSTTGQPSISITNISGLTVTVQYSNLSNTIEGPTPPDSLWVQNENLSKPTLEIDLTSAPSGTMSFTLPSTALEGNYTISPVGLPTQPYVGGVGPGQIGYGVSAAFQFSGGTITPGTAGNSTQPSVSIWAVPTSVTSGTTSTIFWNSADVSSCTETSADGSFSHNSLSGGATTGPLSNSMTYTITCTTANGQNISNSATVTATNSTQTSATIDQNPITFVSQPVTSGATYSMTGSASNTTYLYIALVSAGYNGPTDWNTISNVSNTAVTGGAVHAVVSNGRWTATLPNIVTPGSYKALVYDVSSQTLLTTGTVNVVAASSQPSASIDQSSLTTGFSYPTITGSAANISQIEIDLKGYANAYTTVSNGRWSVPLPFPSSGSYAIQIVDPNSGNVLTQGTLTITPRQ